MGRYLQAIARPHRECRQDTLQVAEQASRLGPAGLAGIGSEETLRGRWLQGQRTQ